MEEKHHQSTLRGPGIKYTCGTSSMLHKPYTSPFIHHLVRQRQLHSFICTKLPCFYFDNDFWEVGKFQMF